jgi:hypothetical protein
VRRRAVARNHNTFFSSSSCALRVVSHTRCAVVRERLLSSGRVGLATGSYLGLEFCRLLALGLGWLEATFRGALRPSRHSSRGLTTGYAIWCHSSTVCDGPYDKVFVGPRFQEIRLLGELGILLFCSPGFGGVGSLLRALSSSAGG